MTYTERFITVPDGLRIFVRDYPAQGQAQGVPVVCLHGLTRNSADFDALAPAIAARGRRVLALDMRGRGRSDFDPDPTRYRPDVYVTDVLAVLDQTGVERAVFIGTSMGGLITMVLSAIAVQRIAGAILNDIGPVVDPAGLKRIAGYVGKTGPFNSWEDFIDAVRTTQSAAFPDADETLWRTFARRTGRETADGKVTFNYDPAIAQAFNAPPPSPAPDLMPLFAALAGRPVLVLRGALSDILAPEGFEAMRAVKPDLQVAEIPRVGHAPTLDEPAARLAIQAFLSHID
jgi:pimeloyl-ACP methyl ester carboxylesterase